MTEYTETEKELIEWYKKLPKFSIGISEIERITKKPLEYMLNEKSIYTRTDDDRICTHGDVKNKYLLVTLLGSDFYYNIKNLKLMKNWEVGYISDVVHEGVATIGFPVREAKGKYLKRLWLKYFH